MSGAAALSEAERALVRLAIAEDLPSGDVTSEAIVPADLLARAVVVAREAAVVAGLEAARAVFAEVEPRVAARAERAGGAPVGDGDRVLPGDQVLALEGPARGILAAERTALNFLGRLSGVATLTRAFVDAVSGTGVQILDTRKTTPGWRSLEKAAVRAGGGVNHRADASTMILVKDNHRALLGGVRACLDGLAAARARGRSDLPVEIEADDLADVCALVEAGASRILLDNMSPAALRRAVDAARGSGRRVTLEASGGVRLETVRAIAETGVDAVSVGALTRSARWIDFSLEVLA
jgi:nicotinate-nucleotide pyrophosphorylase (carboxylating)